MVFSIIKYNLEKAWGIHWGNSAEISHFVRKVERQTFIQIWTYHRPAVLLSLKVYISRIFRLTVYVHTLFTFGLMFRSILCWVAPLCVKFHFVTQRDRDKLRDTELGPGLFYGNVNTLSCDCAAETLAYTRQSVFSSDSITKYALRML